MTRKHFDAIIYAFGRGLNVAAGRNEVATGDRNSLHGEDLRIARLTAQAIADTLADELASLNIPRFDRARFELALLDACGEQLEPTVRACSACSTTNPIRERNDCEFCGGSGRLSRVA